MSSIVLCNISDANSVIEEEKMHWIYGVLDALGVPEEVRETKNIDEFRERMEEMGIEVVLTNNGYVNVYKKVWHEGPTPEQCGWLTATDEHLVAQWKEPEYIMKLEGTSAYYEIHLHEWSILNMRQNR